ncbi:S-adenosyl-L-methionine-dependent methyltransferase [Morchella snyderi]|nr:S-adenosyl-L-methionine-dependent methyltransferase [Morchella snyderi]
MPYSDTDPDSDSDADAAAAAAGFDLFTEPADFRPPDKPATFAHHTLTTGARETLTVRLVGHNPLWGHMLWHAGRITSEYLEAHAAALIAGKRILELGAGAGLPSLVCALRGAARVVVTDYPDPDLVANLRENIAAAGAPGNVFAEGYIWGRDVAGLMGEGEGEGGKFDVLVLSDLLFNHSQHGALAATVKAAMKADGVALVFFTPHRPWLLSEDLAFFQVAEEAGFEVRKVLERKLEAPMFEEDPGDRELRRTVFGYELRWADPGKVQQP